MAFVSFLNYWAASMVLVLLLAARSAGGDTSGQASQEVATGDNSGAFLQVLLIGALVAAVCVVVLVARRTLGAARSTVTALGSGVTEGARDVRLGNLADELAIATGIKPVKVAVLDDPVPNALSVGAGSRMTIVVTSGLLDQFTRDELEAVLAVEMCAIRRLDVALRTAVSVCANGAIKIHDDTKYQPTQSNDRVEQAWTRMNWCLATVVLLPIRLLSWPSWRAALRLRQIAYSHGDMGADDMAIAIIRNPDALGSALTKVLKDPGTVRAVTAVNAPLWLEPLPEPTTDRQAALARHSMDASLEDRIARLQHTARPI